MKNFSSVVDEIYEFLDEFLGSFVPGVYFCSYFVVSIWIFIHFCGDSNSSDNAGIDINEKIFILILFVISYVLGTMFRRSNSREPDHYSAKLIYFNSIPHDDNDFSFIRLISDEKYKKFCNNIIDLRNKKEIRIRFKKKKLQNRKRKFRILERIFYSSYKKRNNNYRLYSKPEVLDYIYKKLLKRSSKLDKLYKILIFKRQSINDEKEAIDKFIDNYNLSEYCNIYVDYPYDNLKQYLDERGMTDLSKYIKWDMEDGNSKTKRTKSLICNMKSYIKHASPSDYGALQKMEAHIRFMNSIWYANKLLSKISSFFLAFCGAISIFMFIIIDNKLLKMLYNNCNNKLIVETTKFIINSTKEMLSILFGGYIGNEKLLKALICVTLISLLYVVCGIIIKRTLANNFHYQRIREVVSVLYIYDILKNEKDKKLNED